MNIFYKKSWLFVCTLFFCGAALAQQDWPKNITGDNGDQIKIYQPQVESFSNNVLKSRSAVSVIQSGKQDPIFGAFWWEANVADNGTAVSIQSLQINNIKFPDGIDDASTDAIKEKLEAAIPQMKISISRDELENSLNNTQQQAKLSNSFNNTPPRVIYTTKPSMLVLIDGEPKLQSNPTYGVEVVVNSPFTIVKNKDGRFYLYGGKQWYSATAVTGPYSYTNDVPDNLQQIENAVKNSQNTNGSTANSAGANTNENGSNEDAAANNVIPDIIVSTTPAELIQSNGEANFAPVENTSLLYVKNSSNDIFMDVNSQQYYVLMSGRWYKSSSLKGQWQFMNAGNLPADFAKIPAGSPKDNVLASVAGTDQANEAIEDAAVPQTAKVDRKTASTSVSYDGDPQFENISGTRLQYAVNASATVLKLDGRYYAIDNGVWYQGSSANGPWSVSDTRPEDVDRIPPSYPVYNSKYVYVYDVTPDYVYTGYTPGYLNAYVYGPTLVYGTGYYYRPWWRNHYYARPYTWGFSMNYTPWYGWGFGYGFGYDWFDIGFGFGSWWGGGYRYGGWWGPSIYRPAFCGIGYRNYGYYGYNRGYAYRNSARINSRYSNNIYNNRRNVYAYNNRSFVNNNRYNGNYNRNGAFNNYNRGGNRFNGSGSGRYGNNGFNGNRSGNNGINNNRNFNRPDNGSNNNRFNNSSGNRFGNRNNNTPNATGTPGRSYNPGQGNQRSFDNNRSFSQPSSGRQREYTPQRSTDNNRSFSRPQSVERPQRSAPSFGSGNGGSRPSYGGSSGGGGSRPSFGGSGGSRSSGGGGGGGSRGGGGGGRHGR